MTITISDNGGNWDFPESWNGGTVPTMEDDIVATKTSGCLVITHISICRNIDLSNYKKSVEYHTQVGNYYVITILKNESEIMDYINSNIVQ